jgi:hypothetical protein
LISVSRAALVFFGAGWVHEAYHLAVHFLLIMLLTAALIKARSVFFQQELAKNNPRSRHMLWIFIARTKFPSVLAMISIAAVSNPGTYVTGWLLK